MAGSKIKGITIEIDGNTQGLDKALQDVNSKSRDLQGELYQVQRALKFDPGNTTLLKQQQQLLSEQVAATTEKLNRLKDAQYQVEKQFQSGQIGAEQYRAFEREIVQTESKIKNLKETISKVDDGKAINNVKEDLSKIPKQADDAEKSVKELGGELTNLVAGAAAGAGIGEAIEKALDFAGTQTKLDISMELDPESVQIVKDSISTVESYGVDAESSLEGVRRQWALNKDASDESNQAVVKGAAAIVSSYGDVDFTELIQETNELSKSLGISNEESLGLTYSLLKMGFPPDQLDIITEYGSQLKNAGYNATEIQGIMAAGVKTGSWNIDVLLDGLKEGRIKLAEFGQGIDKTTAQLLQGTSISATQLQTWGQQVAQGGEVGKTAMQQVAAAVAGIDDKTKQNQIGVAIYGTLWEENGTKITDTITGMNGNMMTATANQNNLNGAISGMDSNPAVQMKQAMSDLTFALAPVMVAIADIISKIALWVQDNPTLAATIVAIVSVLGILIGILGALAPIITMITAILAPLEISLAAITWPVLAVIAVIAALIAIGVALYNNWDWISSTAGSIWESIKAGVSGFVDSTIGFFNRVIGFVTNNWKQILLFLVNPFVGAFSLLYNNCDAFRNFINDFISRVINLFAAITFKMKEIGRNIVEGLKNGISNAWSGLMSWLGDKVDGITRKIKSVLNIHSPSRVMEKLGEYTGEGFAIGMENTIGQISQASDAMANAVNPTPSFSGSSTSNGFNAGNTVLYAQNPIYLDGKIIANATTPLVVSNINRTQINRNKSMGRL